MSSPVLNLWNLPCEPPSPARTALSADRSWKDSTARLHVLEAPLEPGLLGSPGRGCGLFGGNCPFPPPAAAACVALGTASLPLRMWRAFRSALSLLSVSACRPAGPIQPRVSQGGRGHPLDTGLSSAGSGPLPLGEGGARTLRPLINTRLRSWVGSGPHQARLHAGTCVCKSTAALLGIIHAGGDPGGRGGAGLSDYIYNSAAQSAYFEGPTF